MKVRLFSGRVCIAHKEMKTDQDYQEIAHASMLILNGCYYSFCGIFDGCVNFEQCEGPAVAHGFTEH